MFDLDGTLLESHDAREWAREPVRRAADRPPFVLFLEFDDDD